MKYKTYNEEANFITKVVLDASKIIKKNLNNVHASFKGKDDIVTNVDIEIENFIISKMKEKFPNHSIVSEEFNPDGKMSENCYTIDPIDGTVNFANGLGHYGIQIALVTGGKNVVSVIFFPNENELFTATLGGGAWLNGKPISVRKTPFRDMLYHFVISHKAKFDSFEILNEIKTKVSRHVRIMGSQSGAFANVACGRLGATVFGCFTRWDFEPGRLLVEEAGGKFLEVKNKYVIAGFDEEAVKVFDEIVSKYYN